MTLDYRWVATSLVVMLAATCLLPGCYATTPAKTASFKAKPLSKAPVLKFDWRKRVRPKVHWAYKTREYSDPVYVDSRDDLIVANALGEVTRMRAGNGKVIWRKKLLGLDKEPMPVHANMVVTKDMVYVGTLNGTVHALKLSDGSSVWQYRAEDAVESTLVFSEGRLLFTDSREILYALDAETGKLLWRYQRPTPEFFTIKGGGVPVVDDGSVFCGFADGTLAALELDTGNLLWTVNLAGNETEFTDVDLAVILDGKQLYANSYAGGLYAINPVDGSVKWRAPVTFVSSKLFYQGVLYFTTAQGRVMALDVESKKFLWSFRFQKDTPVKLSRFGPYLFVSTSDGPLTVIDRASGMALSKWNPGYGFNTSVVFSPTGSLKESQRGFVLSNGGYLYSFKVAFPSK